MDQPSFPAGSVKDDLDAFNQGEGDAESRGGDHREIQDNGTGGRTRNVAGENTFRGDYPLPPDPNTPNDTNRDSSGSGEEISDFGLNEGKEVGSDASVASSQQALEGDAPAAGGKQSRNTVT